MSGITIGGIDWTEPLLEFGTISSGKVPQISVLDILRQFHIPSPNEKSHVIALLAFEEHEAAELASQIQISKSDLQSLEARKHCIDNRIKELRHSISSIRRVPFEIWEEILSLNCTCGDARYVLEVRGPTERDTRAPCACRWKLPAYPLSQLSYRWRELVKNVPRLWSRVSINLDGFPAPLRPLVEMYGQHSQGQPVDMRLTAGTSWDPRRGNYPEPCIETFRSLSTVLPQCQTLDILLPSGFLQRALFSSQPFSEWTPSFPYLTHLTLRTEPDALSSQMRRFWDAMRAAPNLGHVTLSVMPGLVDVLPSAQLVSLEITRVTETRRRNLGPILSHCPSLSVLRLRYLDPIEVDAHSPAVISVPSLRELDVAVMQFPDKLSPLFERFTFRSLRNLRISLTTPDGGLGWITKTAAWSSTFITSFQRSAYSIDQMTLDFSSPKVFPDGVPPLLPVIRAACNVKRLDIRWSETRVYPPLTQISPIFDLIHHFDIRTDYHLGRRTIAPKLEELMIKDEVLRNPRPDTVRAILDMVESRIGGAGSSCGGALQRFQMVYGPRAASKDPQEYGSLRYSAVLPDSPTAQNVRRLEVIKSQGVRCEITECEAPSP
ncbi:hypothetical protein V5O48_002344 [Marasmius crinis-equi]|uniref:F-box domain-containing protein n=1 Tax=Marasmius crinis-equi TaxID=585013 RepID=A0ABR3FVW2_9AGAR